MVSDFERSLKNWACQLEKSRWSADNVVVETNNLNYQKAYHILLACTKVSLLKK